MSTTAYLIIGLVAAIVLALLLRSIARKPKRGKIATSGKVPTSPKSASTPKNTYRAASIVPGRNACEAAEALSGKRFLVTRSDIPPLPLPDCTASSCTCKYAHHADRRDAEDVRRAPRALRTELHSQTGNAERRAKRGRRASDWE